MVRIWVIERMYVSVTKGTLVLQWVYIVHPMRKAFCKTRAYGAISCSPADCFVA